MSDTITGIPKRNRAAGAALYWLWVVVAATVAFKLITIYTVLTGRFIVALGGADPRLPLSSLPQVLQADLRPGSEGFLTDVPIWVRVLCATPALVEVVVLALGALWLAQIIRRIASGRSFESTTIRRWSNLSALLVIGGIAQGAIDTIAVFTVSGLAQRKMENGEFFFGGDYQGIGTNIPQWPMFTILLGIVAAALALAFRAGSRLEEEVAGVV